MNKLLRFNPEPFETESEIAGTLRGGSPFSYGAPVAPLSAPEWETAASVRPRRPTRPRPTLPSQPAPSSLPAFDSLAFRQKIVRLANQELARWGNGKIKETDPKVRRVLQDYWKTGTGTSYREDQLGDPAFQNDHPWSAAFISWIMKTAGAGTAFKYSTAHATYTRSAKDNRLANNDNPFKAYRIGELAPQVGDLVCKSRSGSAATYENIRPGMKTHCDIVTEVRPRSIVTVGGNVKSSVAHKILRTDANGRMAEPDYFAVIRIGEGQPSVPVAPRPLPVTPSAGAAPRLIRRESTPVGTTLYVDIDLKILDKLGITAPPVTGIFIPDGYAAGATADLILYLHGFKAEAIKRQAIDQYWNAQRFPYGALREGVNAGGRNVILVAPTLGSRSEAKRLVERGGLDAYLAQVLAALNAHGPSPRASSAPSLGNLIFACHSGGGWPMRQIAGGSDRALARLRECWGYDCTYNKGDDAFWAGWARARPNARVYIYYIAGSPTARLAEALRDKRVPNAIVQPSRDRRHNYVPITHWKERIQGAPFLAARSGAIQAPPSPAAPVGVWAHEKTPGSAPTPPMVCSGVDTTMTEAQAKKIKPGHADPKGRVHDRKSEYPPEQNVLLAKHLTHYDVNEWRPERKEKHYDALNEIARFIENWLSAHSDSRLGITITGSASRTGSKEYNDTLSCKRAKAAADWLENGIRHLRHRTDIDPSGEGFSKATCRTKTDCENPDYRSVLITVHPVKKPPVPIPPEPPKGWCKYKIRCCSFKSETLTSALVSQLLSQAMPEEFKQYLKRYPFLNSLINNLLKKVTDLIKSKLPSAVRNFDKLTSEILKYIVVELIQVNAVFEIVEREKADPKDRVLCYLGYGVRAKIPAIPLPKELEKLIESLPIGGQLRKAIKGYLTKIFNKEIELAHLESKCFGDFRNFDLVRLVGSSNTPVCENRHIEIFEGSASVGTALVSAAVGTTEIGIAFSESNFPLKGVRIGNCDNKDKCWRRGIMLSLGQPTGSEIFLTSEGQLKPGEQCKCIECTRISRISRFARQRGRRALSLGGRRS